MTSTLFRLILLVSLAHALVHIYESSFPSVEQLVAQNFHVGADTTGWMNTWLRLPFGLFAIAAGWFTDRFGERKSLLLYLFGCAICALLIANLASIATISIALFAMGMFASIYHPAGLAMLSHVTTHDSRPHALGIHGIFGSLGIGSAPLIAAVAFNIGATWQQYYLLLAGAGLLLGVLFAYRLKDVKEHEQATQSARENVAVDWKAFNVIAMYGMVTGLIYAAFLAFLPRYLGGADITWGEIPEESVRNYLTGGVLLLGAIGQYTCGRFVPRRHLELSLATILFVNAVLLLWMAVAEGFSRVIAAGFFALTHFMNQPPYNSLIAVYTPRHRRSLCYGITFTMGFGFGSFGGAIAGIILSSKMPQPYRSFTTLYQFLALLAAIATLLGLYLWHIRKPHNQNLTDTAVPKR